jgi:hypothetical protein
MAPVDAESCGRVLLVDLNNFARYPTLSVGYLVRILRTAGWSCDVLSPLTYGCPGVRREPRAMPWSLLDQRVRYRSAVSRSRFVAHARDMAASFAARGERRLVERTRAELCHRVAANVPDVVLVSTYLRHFEACRAIAEVCGRMGLPVLIGGPYLNHRRVLDEWLAIPGVTGIVSGEVEFHLADLVSTARAKEDVSVFPGVVTPASPHNGPAEPLKDLDAVPFPDFSDFPWELYPHRIVPLITGRGCGWGVCTFCSDVVSATGRTARSRSLANVFEEVGQQARTYATRSFVFTDLKLNSNLTVWRGLLDELPRRLPAAQWIGAVHVGSHGENGLSRREVGAAARAGAVRLTTGLESGSQRLLDRMAKGTDLFLLSRFLADARRAGISIRTTMILGYPDENAADVLASAAFLARHRELIDRVTLNRLAVMAGTELERRLRVPEGHGRPRSLAISQSASWEYRPEKADDPRYRSAVYDLLHEVHRINRRKLPPRAGPFDGVM